MSPLDLGCWWDVVSPTPGRSSIQPCVPPPPCWGSPTGEEPRCPVLGPDEPKPRAFPRERSPWGCLVSPGSSSKGGTAPPKHPSAPPAAEGWGKRLGAPPGAGQSGFLSSAARSLHTSLPGLPTAGRAGCWGQGSSGDVAAEDGRMAGLWLQGMGELEGRGCKGRESSRTVAAGDGRAPGTWLQGTGELGGCGCRGWTSFGGRAGTELRGTTC